MIECSSCREKTTADEKHRDLRLSSLDGLPRWLSGKESAC